MTCKEPRMLKIVHSSLCPGDVMKTFLILLIMVLPAPPSPQDLSPAQQPSIGASESSKTASRNSVGLEEEASWRDSLSQAIAPILLTILGIIAAVLKKQKDQLAKRLERFFSPPPIKVDETFCSTLVLGIGGSGKTTLVRRLTEDPTANPAKATNEFRIHGITFELPANSPNKRCRFYVADYIGQNLGSLIRGFVEAQQEGGTALAYGFITSLVLVVDLVEPPELAGDSTEPTPIISKSRVKRNLDAWNEQALSAVYGLLTAKLQFVCLFVNKADAISRSAPEVEKEARALYAPLHSELGKRARGAEFLLTVGSADKGAGVAGLKESLVRHSISSKELRSSV